MNLNKAQLIGRVTNDPELKALPSGMPVVKFGLATNHVFKTKEGEKKETAQFHNVVAFGKVAEIIGQWVQKGQEVYVEGRIEYRTWDKKDGSKGYATEIVLENFQMGAKSSKSGAGRAEEPRDRSSEIPSIDVTEGEIKPEDLPF